VVGVVDDFLIGKFHITGECIPSFLRKSLRDTPPASSAATPTYPWLISLPPPQLILATLSCPAVSACSTLIQLHPLALVIRRWNHPLIPTSLEYHHDYRRNPTSIRLMYSCLHSIHTSFRIHLHQPELTHDHYPYCHCCIHWLPSNTFIIQVHDEQP